jgi:hypothetical protein
VLADVDGLTLFEMHAPDVAGAIAAEGDVSGAVGLGHEDWHAGEDALERSCQGFHSN